jgi:hypothetical protein
VNSPNNPNNATPSYLCPAGGGNVETALAIKTQTIVKASPGAVLNVSVLIAGTQGAIYDTASTAALVTANEIAIIPAAVGMYTLNFPCLVGITVAPGAVQVVSVSYQ